MDKRKKLWIKAGIIVLHFIVIGMTVARFAGERREPVTIDEVPLFDSQGTVQGVNHCEVTGGMNSEYKFMGTAIDIGPGVYDVTIQYKTNLDNNYVYVKSWGGEHSNILLADDFLLNKGKKEFSFQIWLNHRAGSLDVVVKPAAGSEEGIEGNYLTVDKIIVSRKNIASLCYFLCKAAAFLLAMDFFLFLAFYRTYIKENVYVCLGLGAAVLIGSLGVLDNSMPRGHDMTFHLARIWGVAQGIKAGQFPVRIQPDWCNGYGFPVSIFYGEAFLYFPAILTLLKVPLVYAYKIYIVCANIGTALISYLCFKRISKDKYIGVTCSVAYTLSMYRICNLYVRAAVGEHTAMMFYPVVILGMWEILKCDGKEKSNGYSWIVLTVGMTGLIQTHVLSCEMVALFMIFACLCAMKKLFRRDTLFLFIKSICMTVCLNAFFLVPFLDYSREDLNVFADSDFYGIQQGGLRLYDLFALTTKGGGASSSAYAGRIPITLGLSAILILLMGVVVLARNREWEGKEKSIITTLYCLTILSIVMTLNVFPWDSLEKIGGLHKLVGSIQYPFRFMAVAMALTALLACLILTACKRTWKRKDFAAVLLVLCFIAAYQSMEFTDRILISSDNYVKYDGQALAEDCDSLYGGQYYYRGTDYILASQDDSIGGNTQIDSLERSKNEYVISCSAPEAAYLELPLFYYPDYACVDRDTGIAYQTVRGYNNKLRINLPAGYQGTLKVAFVEPWYWRMAEVVSLLSIAVLVVIVMRRID